MMRKVLVAAAAITLSGSSVQAQSSPDVSGRWRDSDGESRIAIARCGEALCGRIVWLKQPRVDGANPVPKLRARSLIGVQVLRGFRPDSSGRLSGEGYNPEDGRTYATTLALDAAGRLVVRGCVLGGIFCDDDLWTREP